MRCNSWTCNTLIQTRLLGQGLARIGNIATRSWSAASHYRDSNGNLTSTECESASRWIFS